MRPRVLVIDDEPDIVRVLDFALEQAGFDVDSAPDAATGLLRIRKQQPDALVLDVMLPDLPGTEVCRQLKSSPKTANLPVIMLTARGDEVDRVVGFELGADDYIVKPFSVREVVLRVRAVLRRGLPGEVQQKRDQLGPLKLDHEAHRAFVDGEEIELTALEFRLLSTFMERAGRVQTREQLLRDVWEMAGDLQTRTVDTHVKRLREKLGEAGNYLKTVRGVGYRFADTPDEADH